MIIPGNALLALLSPPQESQGTREEEGGFGTLLTEIEQHATALPDQEEAEIRLNVLALVRLTRAALPGMVARGRGAIINVSSLAAFAPGPYDAIYGATKAFVNSFTEALHEELYGTGVHVQTLCPGFTYTEFQQRAGIDISKIPTFAWMTPEAVVDASLRARQRRQVGALPQHHMIANRWRGADQPVPIRQL
jgi:short-subunit dehydrogenase